MASPSLMRIVIIALSGGILGALLMLPLRKALIVKEHGVLPYPEGTACAEVLIAGETGGAKAKTVFTGLGIGSLFKFIADGIKLFPSEIEWGYTKIQGSSNRYGYTTSFIRCRFHRRTSNIILYVIRCCIRVVSNYTIDKLFRSIYIEIIYQHLKQLLT